MKPQFGILHAAIVYQQGKQSVLLSLIDIACFCLTAGDAMTKRRFHGPKKDNLLCSSSSMYS